jgi:hypothetical protein
MTILFLASLVLIAVGLVGMSVFLKVRTLKAIEESASFNLTADRYRPMLRLLSEDDFTIVKSDPKLRKSLRSHRRELFRGYLRCLTKDYGRMLAGLRHAIVQSGTDRPELSRAIAKNRLLFAWTICKIEYRLVLHATGASRMDVSNLVQAMEVLRTQLQVLSASPAAAYQAA